MGLNKDHLEKLPGLEDLCHSARLAEVLLVDMAGGINVQGTLDKFVGDLLVVLGGIIFSWRLVEDKGGHLD